MAFNLRRYSRSLNKKTVSTLMQPGKSLLETILEAFDIYPEDDFATFFDATREINPKTTPEGSKGLTAQDSINRNGIPVVIFSDGGKFGFCDYRKLQKSTDDGAKHFCEVIDGLLKNGQYELVTMYKPDGSTFETHQLKRPPIEAIKSKKLRKIASQKAPAL